MHILFIFLDGIGLGENDPQKNPFARAALPNLGNLLAGRRLLDGAAPFHGERATLLALDASLGVDGLPQSATGQAALLTGRNVPAEIGYHYGPKPNPDVARYLRNGHNPPQKMRTPAGQASTENAPIEGTLFSRLRANGKTAALLNAYPEGYFKGINSGRRLYSAVPLAATQAGLPLFTQDDLFAGRALSADFTGRGWRELLKVPDAPLLSPREAGRKLGALAGKYDFSFFEYWASDYAGHRQDMDWAVRQLETFDGVLAGLLENPPEDLLVLVTSDHGNMEDLSTRRHTDAKVPCLLIGPEAARQSFGAGLHDLTGIAPAILDHVA
ncbi:MAG: metalloenzyme domain-containing protein [Chloroflexi bacterium]|nr:metalloenzyme domain-containing protein [Chloroflexota bacterium]